MGSRQPVLDVDTEKMIVRNVLLRLFNPTMTSALLEGFYASNPGSFQFLEAAAPQPAGAIIPTSTFIPSQGQTLSHNPPQIPAKPGLNFQVTDFVDTFFAKDYFPKFKAVLSSIDGTQEPLPRELAEFQVTISIRNKWVEITPEVLGPTTELVRTVRNGVLEVSDLMFVDVSLKHGGFFTLHLTPMASAKQLVNAWQSPRFVIQSVKTHCNKKRKSRETPANPPMMMAATRDGQLTPQMLDGFSLNDAKAFLGPHGGRMPHPLEFPIPPGNSVFDLESDSLSDFFRS